MKLNEIRNIGVIGAGLMGHGIAQVFASAGYGVKLYDSDSAMLETVKERIASNFKVFIELGMATPEDADNCLDRVGLCSSLEEFCRGLDYIIEAIVEELTAKREIYARVEPLVAPGTLLSSNTSAISITEISRALDHPGRFLGTHFWNPPHVLPCVEVIKGADTDEDSFETVYALMEKAGKVPVRVHKDVPGFIGNRLQHAMWREAISLTEKGVASAEDIDKVVKYGPGLRMPFIGPLETADLAGLGLSLEVQRYLFPYLDTSAEPSPLLTNLVSKGASGVRAGQGFYSWPPEKIRSVIETRDKVLLRILQEIASRSSSGGGPATG